MRARIYTPEGTLGLVDLVDGADVADVVRAMREHRLFITPVEAAAQPEPVTTTLPEAKSIDEVGAGVKIWNKGEVIREPEKRRRVRE